MNKPITNLAIAVVSTLGLFVCLIAPSIAADDDIVFIETLQPQTANLARFGALTENETFDQWVFGTDFQTAEKAVAAQLKRKLDEFTKRHSLSEDKRSKLQLAAEVDRRRLFQDFRELKFRFNAIPDRDKAVEILLSETLALIKRRKDVLGQGSFFDKASKKILEENIRSESRQVDQPTGVKATPATATVAANDSSS